MTSAKQFHSVLTEWIDIFIGRSMTELMRFVKASGLSMPQYRVLMHLHEESSCTMSDIGAHLDVSPAATSQMVDRMVQMGLLERTEAVHDRRAKQLALTARGRALVEAGLEARSRWTTDLVKSLSAEERAQAAAVLTRLAQSVRQLPPG